MARLVFGDSARSDSVRVGVTAGGGIYGGRVEPVYMVAAVAYHPQNVYYGEWEVRGDIGEHSTPCRAADAAKELFGRGGLEAQAAVAVVCVNSVVPGHDGVWSQFSVTYLKTDRIYGRFDDIPHAAPGLNNLRRAVEQYMNDHHGDEIRANQPTKEPAPDEVPFVPLDDDEKARFARLNPPDPPGGEG